MKRLLVIDTNDNALLYVIEVAETDDTATAPHIMIIEADGDVLDLDAEIEKHNLVNRMNDDEFTV